MSFVYQPVNLSAASVQGVLPVLHGGSSVASINGYLYGNGVSAFTGSPSIPFTDTTGTVNVQRGGTGATSLTANNVLLGNGTSPVQVVAPGSNGNVLTSNGTTWVSSAAAGGGGFTSGTSISLSGSSATFTGIPSGTKFIIVEINNIWITNGPLWIQLGTSSGINTTTYTSGTIKNVSTGTHTSAAGVGDSFRVYLNNATAGLMGHYFLSLENASTNNWVGSGVSWVTDGSGVVTGGGNVFLSSACTQLRLTVDSGQTFQAGSANILYSS